jgi:hypothetical protein
MHIGAFYHTYNPSANIYRSAYVSSQWLTKQTLRSRVLLEKSPVTRLLKNSPIFYGTQRCITVFTTSRHWSLSWARWMQSIPPYPFSLISCIRLSSCLFPSGFPTESLRARLTHACYFPRQSHPLWVDNSNISWDIQNMKLLSTQFSRSAYCLISFRAKYSPPYPVFKYP